VKKEKIPVIYDFCEYKEGKCVETADTCEKIDLDYLTPYREF
jgi:hypothetical protein